MQYLVYKICTLYHITQCLGCLILAPKLYLHCKHFMKKGVMQIPQCKCLMLFYLAVSLLSDFFPEQYRFPVDNVSYM